MSGALCALLTVACSGPPAQEAPIETVDVAETVDSQIEPEEDIRAKVREKGLVGVLPGDFPEDLWAYQPASIVDLGYSPDGRGYVGLRTVGALADVRQRLLEEQEERGWEGSVAGPGLVVFRKGGRRAQVALEAKGNETWMRMEYPPA